MGVIRRPRPPRLICPPLRPATRASSGVHSCAVPFSCAARPPLLAISRCFSGDIEANPRRSFRPSTALLLVLGDQPRRDRGDEALRPYITYRAIPALPPATRGVPPRPNLSLL